MLLLMFGPQETPWYKKKQPGIFLTLTCHSNTWTLLFNVHFLMWPSLLNLLSNFIIPTTEISRIFYDLQPLHDGAREVTIECSRQIGGGEDSKFSLLCYDCWLRWRITWWGGDFHIKEQTQTFWWALQKPSKLSWSGSLSKWCHWT